MILSTVILIVLLTSCVTVPTIIEVPIEYRESDHASYRASGSGKVSGQVFLRTQGGDVKVGAGSDVGLMPATNYFEQYYIAVMKEVSNVEQIDPRASGIAHKTKADATGNFEFSNLAEGQYFVVSEVYWKYVSRYGARTTGSTVGQRISVRNGETTKVVLTE